MRHCCFQLSTDGERLYIAFGGGEAEIHLAAAVRSTLG